MRWKRVRTKNIVWRQKNGGSSHQINWMFFEWLWFYCGEDLRKKKSIRRHGTLVSFLKRGEGFFRSSITKKTSMLTITPHPPSSITDTKGDSRRHDSTQNSRRKKTEFRKKLISFHFAYTPQRTRVFFSDVFFPYFFSDQSSLEHEGRGL